MAVPVRISDLSTTAASNSPAGTDAIGNSLDDYLRGIQRCLRLTNAIAGSSIASAATTDLSTVDEEMVSVTGTVTITSLGTLSAGIRRVVRFTGALTLTHSSNLVLPNATNYTTQADDVGLFRSLGSGAWICEGLSRPASSAPGSNSITTAMLQNASVTYAKIQNVSATDKVLGRQTAGAGSVEEIACTASGRAMLAAASAGAQATLLTLGTASDASLQSLTLDSGKKLRKWTLSTSAPSGGNSGDVWMKY